MVGLFQAAFANFDDICKILPHFVQELLADTPFAREKSVKWILIIGGLFLYGVKGLEGREYAGSPEKNKQITHARQCR